LFVRSSLKESNVRRLLKSICGAEFNKLTLEVACVNVQEIQDLSQPAGEKNGDRLLRLSQNKVNGMTRKLRLANAIRFWVFELQKEEMQSAKKG
jgi:hypothetical protein